MANETRHAAWQSERRFAVRLLPEEGDPTELADGLGDFLEAVDFAVEWLAREDPDRTGTSSLAIFATGAGETEKVWAYPPEDSPENGPLMKIFGFDPVSWKPASEFAHREPALGTFFTRAPEGMLPRAAVEEEPVPEAAEKVAPAAVLPLPAAPPPIPVAPPQPRPVAPPRPAAAAVRYEEPTAPGRPHLRPRRALAAAWDDTVARSFLFLAAVSLWLAVAFADPGVLAFVVVALSGLWWRRDKLIGMAETDSEDWI